MTLLSLETHGSFAWHLTISAIAVRQKALTLDENEGTFPIHLSLRKYWASLMD